MNEGLKLLMKFTIISEIYKMLQEQAVFEIDSHYKNWCGRIPEESFIPECQERLLKAGILKNKLLQRMSHIVYSDLDEEMKTSE